jgi:hypothetical protein
MCTVLLPPGVNPIAVKDISYHIITQNITILFSRQLLLFDATLQLHESGSTVFTGYIKQLFLNQGFFSVFGPSEKNLCQYVYLLRFVFLLNNQHKVKREGGVIYTPAHIFTACKI